MGKQNRKLIKNMEEYAKKEKAKQQESKVLEQREKRRSKNQKENINVHSSSQRKSLWGMVRKRLKNE